MNEPLRLAVEAPASETLEASGGFESFYDAESRRCFAVCGSSPGTARRRRR